MQLGHASPPFSPAPPSMKPPPFPPPLPPYLTHTNPTPTLAPLHALLNPSSSPSPHLTLNSSHFRTLYSLRNTLWTCCILTSSRGSPVPLYTTSSVHGGRAAYTAAICWTVCLTAVVRAWGEGFSVLRDGIEGGQGLRLSIDHPRRASSSRRRAQVSSTPPPGMYAPSGSPLTVRWMPATMAASVVQAMLKAAAIWPKVLSGALWSTMAPCLPGVAAVVIVLVLGTRASRLKMDSRSASWAPHRGPFSHFIRTRSRQARASSTLLCPVAPWPCWISRERYFWESHLREDFRGGPRGWG